MYAGTFDGRSLLKRQKAQQAHITKYDATFQVVEALFQFRFHWNFSLCVQVQSKDACMQMKVRAYRACWPLAHVYMKQLKQPVAKVDDISTIDEKRDCCEIIWPNPDIYLIPATRWRHVLGMFPGKLYRHLLFPPIKSGSLVAEFAVRHRTKMALLHPSWLALMKIKANEDRHSGRWQRSSNTGLSSLWPLCGVLGNIMKKNGRKTAKRNGSSNYFSQQTRHHWLLNKSWEGYRTRDLSVKTKS